MAARGTLKASDAEREHVAERLRHAAAEGRLLAHELEQRLEIALRARTHAELNAVVADLPRVRDQRRRGVRSLRPAHVLALAIVTPIVVALVLAVVAIVLMMFAAWAALAAILWCVVGHRLRWYGPRRMRPRLRMYGGAPPSQPRPGPWL